MFTILGRKTCSYSHFKGRHAATWMDLLDLAMFLGLCECAIHPASVKLSLIPYFIMALLLFPTFSPQVILSSPLFSIVSSLYVVM